jgi:hypothetical protein
MLITFAFYRLGRTGTKRPSLSVRLPAPKRGIEQTTPNTGGNNDQYGLFGRVQPTKKEFP